MTKQVLSVVNNFLKEGLYPNFQTSDIKFEDLLKIIDSGEAEYKYFFGIGNGGFIFKDPVDNPGLLTIGGQGSGKSTFLKGLCAFMNASFGNRAFFQYCDFTNKGMGDYKMLYKNRANSSKALFEIEKIIPVMDMANEEIERRGQAFKDMDGANNIYQYNRYGKIKHKKYCGIYEKIKNRSVNNLSSEDREFLKKIGELNLLRMTDIQNKAVLKIATTTNLSDVSDQTIAEAQPDKEFHGAAFYFLVFEEFHKVPESDEVRFMDNKNTPGTVANKMFNIARTGRSFGMSILAATQSAKVTEFPTDLKIGIQNIFAHKTSDSYASGGVDLPAEPSSISISGRAVSKDGFSQFPLLSDEDIEKLVDMYPVNKLDGYLFGPQVEDYHKALDGSGAEGMILSYDFRKIIDNYQTFSKSLDVIVRRLLNSFGFEYEGLPKGAVTELKGIASKEGKRFAVFYQDFQGGRRGWGNEISDKKLESFKSDFEILNCESLISIAFGESSTLARFCKSNGGIYLDIEDLRNSASVVDNWQSLEASGNLQKKLELCPLSVDLTDKKTAKKKSAPKDGLIDDDTDTEYDEDFEIRSRLK